VLNRLVFVRQREIFETFPDALDLMTVCVEAGLGIEAALVRVADEMQHKSEALAEELHLVTLELRAGLERARALRNLANRTGVEEVEGFVAMIIQAERFGTSIAASLRIHSDMLRTRRRQRAEEAAAEIALKLLFPLIFFIFPSLMLVLLGPAMIQIYRVLLPTMAGSSGG
jgi:tight adherence protein C